MTNLIVMVVLLIIIGTAAIYLFKAKRRGQKCIGCPYAKECAAKSCNCSGGQLPS